MNVSPSWIAPKAEGNVRSWDAWLRSLSVFGWPDKGVFPWSEIMDSVACAESEGELVKNGCQEFARLGL